jgi:cell wall-associated NlpC family hydrolase
MNPIDPLRSRYIDPTPTHDDTSPAPGPSKAPAPPRDPLQVAAALPDTGGALLARAARAAAAPQPHPVVAMGVEANVLPQDVRVQEGLEAFRVAATPTYRVPGEGDVTVPAPFRMPHEVPVSPGAPRDDGPYATHERNTAAHQVELRSLAAKLGIPDLYAAHIGHASPETVRRLTQSLIDAGRLPPPDGKTSTAVRVRTMMADYGLGFDCAGYVQQAFLAAHGLTRPQAGFAAGARVESLNDLPAKAFHTVAPESARPGDIVVLDAQGVGHRLIVYSTRVLSPEEVARLPQPSGAPPLVSGKVIQIEVDSSFGSGGDPGHGGVGRQAWNYDPASKTWQSIATDGVFSRSPYHRDVLRGVYRPRAKD